MDYAVVFLLWEKGAKIVAVDALEKLQTVS